jgi:2-polyprenyl-6-hydroxyphenyl methylase/3-demethylubiquinone-9 3-methyltransferase
MVGYYSQKLSGERLRLCYEIAPPRVKQYLEAEIAFVLDKMKSSGLILELGCGYGRVLKRLWTKASTVVGIDTSFASLSLARDAFCKNPRCHLFAMDAVEMGFCSQQFDMVVCIQNGISAFGVDQRKLIKEALRVTKTGGGVLFSSYSEQFWKDRLEWFRLQSKKKLVGEIDDEATGNGVIVCKDGFKAGTVNPDEFVLLTSDLAVDPVITEVDNSSIFYELQRKLDD